MRKRLGTPTIRTRITTLVLIPIVALVALWGFAVVSMTGDLRALIRLEGVYQYFGTPVDTALGQIQIERRMASEYLGSGWDQNLLAEFTTQQHATDEAVRAMHAAAVNPDHRGELSGEQRSRLDRMVKAADGLAALRRGVVTRQIPWDEAVTGYTAIVEPGFEVQSALTALQAGQLAREAQVVIELVRVREYVSREDAMGSGARAAGGFSPAQARAFAATVEDRRVFQRTYVPALPADSRAAFDAFAQDSRYTALVDAEDKTLADGGRSISRESWRGTMDPAVHRYMELCSQAALNSAARGRAYATDELTRAALVGGAGLVAVVFSIWYSIRTGRRITQRLLRLRASANLLAGSRLPSVMRRLSAGEVVDVEAEAPPLTFGADEIGDVGRAFNDARRAAVEAAVEQARLRRGISGVFLNIARRSQSLVHRQLKLLDAMERRVTDPDELADLFRVDHLTTRMRRHAEGLIILSGAAPGRMWRKPVPLVDVIGSAVGGVEDYQRVVIPPMPKVAVVGAVVADLVHLVAELVENATVFSPPQTKVGMRVGEAAGGCVLEIDDRGLGMDPDELAAANLSLAEPRDFDPAQTERLGLFVVGRLARRHGIEVTLCRSPYGGTTAVVFLPGAVLAEEELPPEPEELPVAAQSPTVQSLTVVPSSEAGTGTAVLPMRRRQPAPDPDPAAAPAAPTGLPTRVRQASLAPQLRAAPGRAAGEGEGEAEEVSPEQLGAIFGAFQRGLDRGRSEAPTDDQKGEQE
ncbi:hypothetical protein GCM10010193_30360 [Kitasatospora atroaurantiaca]|uniref:histidine kinase n=1 Tax=Kitasatospora atroaurantiaca TaxID=285545 RepID=A0A561ER04_9ACTN|nr:nitrate- and nitrite sensing domain-containing protein [Kitasatospora atroaurantiaca]TWE18024.1 signal transduction histidine kinase [Kitasatospora atroaurantiaca]